jgi:hypothetical protein
MSSLGTFIQLMDQFLCELMEVFPEEKKLKSYHMKFEALKSTNPKKVLELFMNSVTPVSEYIVNKDETLFTSDKTTWFSDIELDKLWVSGITENTKNAIWSHLNTLYIIGTTIQNIPSDLMKNIEELAQSCAENMDGSGGNMKMDPMQLMSAMKNIMK